MIARLWTARARPDGADAYAAHFIERVVPELTAIEGYQGATLLRSRRGDAIELIVISWWTSEEAVRRFAGPDLRRAVVADEARRALESFDETVRHYEVVACDTNLI
jgi:heme-degrading monooxygenase HmoA